MLALVLIAAVTTTTVDEDIRARYASWEALYQDLHKHPELSLKESRTAAKMATELKRLGLEVSTLGGGVAGVLKNGDGPVTLVRAEMDALPVSEDTHLAYASEVPGVAHACGHDFHMTALVATAQTMIAERKAWKGTIIFVAQPAEEVLKGAQAMLDAGLLTKLAKPNQCIALHTRGALAAGKVGFTPGLAQASADSIDVLFRGVSTHGAAPFRGVDPVVIASEFVLKTQTLIGREVDPLDPAVITVGVIQGGTKRNIVADEVKLQLTMRTFNPSLRARLLLRLEEIAGGLAKNAGAPAPSVTVVESTPVLVNDPRLTETFKSAVVRAVGADQVVESPRVMTSDDFSLFGEKMPCLKFNVGTGTDPSAIIDNHSPKFAPKVADTLPLAVKSTVAGLLELHGTAH